jgi:hypothetical protein
VISIIITKGEGATRAKGDALMFIPQKVQHDNKEDQGAAQARPVIHLV